MDLLASKGSAGEDKGAQRCQFPADPNLLAIAQSVKSDYRQARSWKG